MPRMKRAYCLKTPIKKMGFSQKASCKAQGFIARTSKKNKGRKMKSTKYKFAMNKSLYSNGTKNLEQKLVMVTQKKQK